MCEQGDRLGNIREALKQLRETHIKVRSIPKPQIQKKSNLPAVASCIPQQDWHAGVEALSPV